MTTIGSHVLNVLRGATNMAQEIMSYLIDNKTRCFIARFHSGLCGCPTQMKTDFNADLLYPW